MSDDAFEEYLQSAVILNLQSQYPLPPNILRGLFTLLRETGEFEEKDLKEMRDRKEDPEGHLAFSIRAIAHWLSIASFPIGAWESWKRHGVPASYGPANR